MVAKGTEFSTLKNECVRAVAYSHTFSTIQFSHWVAQEEGCPAEVSFSSAPRTGDSEDEDVEDFASVEDEDDLAGEHLPSQLRTRLPQARQQNWCKNYLTLKLSVKFTLRHPTLLIVATVQIFLTQVWFFPLKKRVQYLVLMASAPHCWRDGELVSRRLYSYVLRCESTLCKTPHFR